MNKEPNMTPAQKAASKRCTPIAPGARRDWTTYGACGALVLKLGDLEDYPYSALDAARVIREETGRTLTLDSIREVESLGC